MLSLSNRVLGILGGMGPRATANFLTSLVAEFNERHITDDSDFPVIIMLSVPLEHWGITGSIDKTQVSLQVNSGLEWLNAAEVEIIAVPCNTVHEFIHDDKVVNIIDIALSKCSDEKIGVLCSRQTRESGLYERKGHNVKYYSNQDSVDSLIESVICGASPDIGLMLNAEFKDCNEIILGCTELSLCTISRSTNKRIIDSTKELAKAVVKRLIQ